MARSVNAEVIASTFDEPAERHVRVPILFWKKPNALLSVVMMWLYFSIQLPGWQGLLTQYSLPPARCYRVG